jgi:hypothetical protein
LIILNLGSWVRGLAIGARVQACGVEGIGLRVEGLVRTVVWVARAQECLFRV